MTNTTISLIFSLMLSFFYCKVVFSKMFLGGKIASILSFTWPLIVAVIFYICMKYICPKFFNIINYKSYEETYKAEGVDNIQELNSHDTIREYEISSLTKFIDYLWFFFLIFFFLAGTTVIIILLIKLDKSGLEKILYMARKGILLLLMLVFMPKYIFSMWKKLSTYHVIFDANILKVYKNSRNNVISNINIEAIKIKYLNDMVVSVRLNLSERGVLLKKCLRIKGFENRKNFTKVFFENCGKRDSVW
jgi:hypothetical protein